MRFQNRDLKLLVGVIGIEPAAYASRRAGLHFEINYYQKLFVNLTRYESMVVI